MVSLPWAGRENALPEEVRQALALGADFKVLDVRTAAEYAAHHIPGAVLIPVNELAKRCNEVDPALNWMVVCEHGVRSRAAQGHLLSRGYPNVCNMVGGMANYPGPVERGAPPRTGAPDR